MSNILQDIFKDNYERMIYTLHPRKSVIENVDRMINCGDPSFGGAMYGCGQSGTLKFVPFRCHSRFCPTCGTKYSIDRTTSMSFKIINVQHRHCVFTIDSELRHFFLEDRELLGLLFEAVQSVILRMFHKDNKTEKFTPGFILVLHTFGRDLKWNPHIHCLLSEGGIGNSGLWRAKTHFNYTYLRNAFRTALLNLMSRPAPVSAYNSSEAVRLRYSWQVLWSYARTADHSACISPFSKINYTRLYNNHLPECPCVIGHTITN